MLLTGAAIIRYANRYLDRFMENMPLNMDFVLFAVNTVCIWDDGKVTFYSLFQEPNNPEVRCKKPVIG